MYKKYMFQINFNELLNVEKFKDKYIKILCDEFGNLNYYFVTLKDGVEEEVEFESNFEYGNHSVNIKDIKIFLEMCGVDLQKVCERADKSNKSIIGFLGKKKSEKIWLIRCNNCGIVRESYMRFFSRCKGCSIISKTKSFSQFLNDAKKKHGEKYIYSENDYVNTSSKIKILCTQCGNYFDQLVRDHLEGHGCSYCNEPKGEIAIRLYLDKINIKYERNKSFSGLVYKSSLKYDFYLTDLNLLIEFDGKQHFEIVNFSRNHKSNLKRFEDSKLRDGIKDDWSKNNNIPLLRIPYWDMNRIPELIDEFLNSNIKKKVNQLCFDFNI